ncbi:MAG: helix-turn-helix transcriptional regulator [Saccharospirillaceae bacterium]|nr:helix-turn-helix transcriptional regulator [Saccharospirillaceae bacterium]
MEKKLWAAADKRRIADVARETGLSRVTETLLYKETSQKVDLNTIEKICLLFGFGIGDFLELQISNKSKENHPLSENK